MLSDQRQTIFFESLLQPLKRRYKTLWRAQYFYFILQTTERVIRINADFQKNLLQTLQTSYRWLNLLLYLDLTRGILSSAIVLSIFIAIPQLYKILALLLSVAAASHVLDWFCHKVKLLAAFVEIKLQGFFGQDIDSNTQADITTLSEFLAGYLIKLPKRESMLTHQTALQKYLVLTSLLNEDIDTTALPFHLQSFKTELTQLYKDAVQLNLENLKSQTVKDLNPPCIQTREDFLTRYSSYCTYLEDYQKVVVISLVIKTPMPQFMMIRDRLSALFTLPSDQSDATKNIAWQAALCEIMRQECVHFFGNSCCESEAYQDTLWWLRDKMNGLDSAPPQIHSCPYFKAYDISQWDGISVQPPAPLILSCSELITAYPTTGAIYAK